MSMNTEWLSLLWAVVTPAGSFGIFAVIGAVTWLFARLYLPEMSGVSLNDVHSHDAPQSNSANHEGYMDVRGGVDGDEAGLNEESSRYVIE